MVASQCFLSMALSNVTNGCHMLAPVHSPCASICVLWKKARSRKCVFYLLQGGMVCDGLQLWRGSSDLFVGVNFCNLFLLSHTIKSVGSIANLENSVVFVM